MLPVSVVIIAKNEAHVLAQTLLSVKALTDDIIVCDTGSNDATIPIAKKSGATVIEEKWIGYGPTKNIANEQAVYDWILQLDADEQADEELIRSIAEQDLNNPQQVFTVRRKNFFKQKQIRFGEWGKDEPIRFFHRQHAVWNADPVHEKLIFEKDCTVKKLKGAILHKTLQSTEQYEEKLKNYALRSADKYFKQGKNATFYKRTLSPVFSFINNYFFRLGFLDGKEGFILATYGARYTRMKYKALCRLQKEQKKG